MTTPAPTLHLRGPILVGADEEVTQAWVHDRLVTFTDPGVGSETVEVRGYVLPGLVDSHCHVGLESRGAVPPQRAEQHAIADRDAGTLLVRDCGSPADTRWIDERVDLPRIIRAGRHIARTKRYLRNYAHEIEPEDLVAYVRQEARRGDGWVKLVGDWIDRDVGDLTPCWPRDALAPAIAAAHEEGARVTAHCFGEQSLHDFADAGVDCIEHATGLTDETIAKFAAGNIAIVPTLVNIANFPDFAAAGEKKFPAYAAHMRDLRERRYETFGRARDAGLRIFAGTDAGGHVPHGLLAHEVSELLHAGLSPREALDAAAWGAREWLGRPAIADGAPADLVVYAEVRGSTCACCERRRLSSCEGSSLADVDPRLLFACGPRVHVSPPMDADVEPYRRATERSARRIGVWNPVNPSDLVHHISAQSNKHRSFLIRAHDPVDDQPLVGAVNVFNIARGRAMSGTLGYNAFDPYSGTGMFAEGLRLVVDLALREPPAGLGLHRVEANVRIGNAASAGVLRSVGFRRERTARRMLWLADGLGGPSAWRDHDSYALTREEWPAKPYAVQDAVTGVLVLGSGADVGLAVGVARELGGVALFGLPFDAACDVAFAAGGPIVWCAQDRADDAVRTLTSRGVRVTNIDRDVAMLAPERSGTSETGPGSYAPKTVTRVALAVRPYLE